MTVLELFEEWRFLLELLAAMLVFILPYQPLHQVSRRRLLLASLPLLGLSIFYFVIKEFAILSINQLATTATEALLIRIIFFGGWYLGILVITLFVMKWAFQISGKDLIFIAVASYALQHIAFVFIHELLAQVLWVDLSQNVILYLFLTIVIVAILYGLIFHYFKPELQRYHHNNLVKSATSQKVYSVMLILLILQAFSSQHIFNTTTGPERYISALSSIGLCALILYAQFITLHTSSLLEEQFILEQLLKERKKQYQVEKEAIDHLNYRIHDFKNQILALKGLDHGEKGDYYEEVLGKIIDYDHVLNLENETLNTLMTQKYHYCQIHHIQLTHMINSQVIDFIKAVDLYALLGNALDNAIECVEQYEDAKDRQVSLQIKQHKQFLVIEVANKFLKPVLFDAQTQLPKSSKPDHLSHGFGLKSIQATVENYKGWMTINSQHSSFIVHIVIPIPQKKAD